MRQRRVAPSHPPKDTPTCWSSLDAFTNASIAPGASDDPANHPDLQCSASLSRRTIQSILVVD
jgi:hypothetical protein